MAKETRAEARERARARAKSAGVMRPTKCREEGRVPVKRFKKKDGSYTRRQCRKKPE